MSEQELRHQLVATARRMNDAGLNQGRSGNLSHRTTDGLLITPSGLAYEAMTGEDIVRVGFDGSIDGTRAPSTELPLHREILSARPEVSAVLHAHPVHATALASLRRPIPAFHYMVAVAGGDSIRVADYAAFGTEELSRHAVAALEGRTACLLANHGLVALGATLDEAFDVAREMETLAAMYVAALAAGEPVLLSAAEMADVLPRFERYRKMR
jgi:L-fuculose-phosphate aldolase